MAPTGGRIEIFIHEERRLSDIGPAGPRDIKKTAEGQLGGEKIVPGLVKDGLLVAEADLGAQDVEASGAAGIEEGALAGSLLAEQLNGLLLGIEQVAIYGDVVDGQLDVAQDQVDGGAQLDKGRFVL